MYVLQLSNTSHRFVDEFPRINVSDYVRAFRRHIEHTQGRTIRGNHRGEAEHLRELLNIPENTTPKSFRDIQTGEYFWGEQRVEFVPSNLGNGRGQVWYFYCNRCGSRVKHLYEISMLSSPLCRTCCRLSYKQPKRKQRALSRLLNKPYLSSEAKYAIIKHAGITKEDVPDGSPVS